jgi:hypothetical protein
MATPSPVVDEIRMDDTDSRVDATVDEETRNDSDSFELTPPDMRLWLTHERKFVRLMSERRIQEATDLVVSYDSGLLTSEDVAMKWREYHSRWPGRICLDRKTEEEIENEATGFEMNPTGESIYRPRSSKRRQLVTTSTPAS